MNPSAKSFSLIVVLTLVLCLLIVNFISNIKDLHSESIKEEIKKFDQKYSPILNALTDSLSGSIGKNFDYFTEGHRDVKDIHFSYLDSAGKSGGHFYPKFKLTDKQADFFTGCQHWDHRL